MSNHQSGSFLHLDDAQLYYEVSGNPGGHPLILLHGGLGNLDDFAPIFGMIPDAFQVVAVDMRGHGRSALGTERLSYRQHQADIEALISHLALNAYSLLGFSDGGIVAYRMAVGNPAVKALVTIGAQWRISRQDPSFEILGGVTPESWVEMFPDSLRAYAVLNPRGNFNELVKSCVSLWTDLGPDGYPQEQISRIACPTLVLRGDNDFLLSLPDAVEARARISGASFGNIPFAGHAAMEDAPKVVGYLLRDFFLRLPLTHFRENANLC